MKCPNCGNEMDHMVDGNDSGWFCEMCDEFVDESEVDDEDRLEFYP